ncbi:MAG TPA: prolipoprotein diacylglyceryl transferase, partial [Bacteroidales bacterium]|nr:prolipoprotein diacylglyceryl transferase [Bacteroidales bacterium]
PTPFYETLICSFCFMILWIIRKRIHTAGVIFAIFLILNGVERFFIEKIRVNTTYHIFGNEITQAEIISTFLVITGVLMLFKLTKKKNNLSSI